MSVLRSFSVSSLVSIFPRVVLLAALLLAIMPSSPCAFADDLQYVNPDGLRQPLPDAVGNSRIINGGPLQSSTSSVVQIRGRDENGTFICTGSVIAPKVILTASHCLANSPSLMSVIISGRTFKVSKFKAPANVRWERSGLIHNDIALLFLEKPTSQRPLRLLLSRKPKPGDSIQILGYGLDEYGSIGTLQGGSSVLSRVTAEFLITVFTSLAQSNSCSGDSGGPAILTYTDKTGRPRSGIIGTISAGTSSRCWIGDRTYFINLQSQSLVKFIQSQVRGLKSE